MPTKTATITARSKVGWAPVEEDSPLFMGNIASVQKPTHPVRWFVGMRASSGMNWWPIISVAQVSHEGIAMSPSTTTETIHGDIMDFLWDFSMDIEYEVPAVDRSTAGRKKGATPRKATRSIRLSDRAWQNIQDSGGAKTVEEWALGLVE